MGLELGLNLPPGAGLEGGELYTAKIARITSGALLVHYRQNEAPDAPLPPADDSSSNGYDGTYNGVTLQGATGPDGDLVALYDGTNDYIDGPLGLRTAFNGAAGTIIAWGKVSGVGIWTDGLVHFLCQGYVDANNAFLLSNTATDNTLRWYWRSGGAAAQDISNAGYTTTDWFVMALTWDHAANEVKAFYNGAQVSTTQAGLGVWVGTPVAIRVGFSSNAWGGGLTDFILCNAALTPAQIAELSKR